MSYFEELEPILLDEDRALRAVDCNDHAPPHALTEKIASPHKLPTSMYGAMLAIWHMRRVAQRRFPLHHGHARDYLRYLAWCATWGRQKYKILTEIPEWDRELAKPIELPKLRGDKWENSFSVGQFLFGITHYHYTVTALLRDRRARDNVARTYWRGSRHISNHPQASNWQTARLHQIFGNTNNLISAIATKRELSTDTRHLETEFGLQDVIDVKHETSKPSFTPLETHFNNRQAYIRLPRKALEALSIASLGTEYLKPLPKEQELFKLTKQIDRTSRPSPRATLSYGVNLFGHARGELGIGEDVRLVALALQSHDIPFCIIDIKPGSNVSQKDESVSQWITTIPKHSINIFCTTGIEHIRYACEAGLGAIEGRYNIGFWPWELPNWPASCHHAYSLVNEIWAISRYTAQAYRDAPCDVHTMSLPVTINQVARMDRESFQLPQDAYLFIFSFDANSTYSRKNPIGVIEAFLRAFPNKNNKKVGLVIKASHVNYKQLEWLNIQRIAKSDPRIFLFPHTIRKHEVLALLKACDCFISLHRAEGFGRGIAEALLLNRHVITTGYSGNLDFCDKDIVDLVKYSLRPLKPGEYFFSEKQFWAEPSIQHASELMRTAIQEQKPSQNTKHDFSPEAIGAIYKQRLDAINESLTQ